jgi:drug/metabolite transporter (DMT)-like permease
MTNKHIEALQQSSFNRAYLALTIGIFATSLAAIFIKLAQNEDVPSLLIADGRLVIATLVLTPLVTRNKQYKQQIRQLSRRELMLIIVSGLFLALHFASWVTSLEYTTVLISGVLVATTPIWVALLEVFVLRANLSSSLIAGLVIAIVGGAIIGLSGGDKVETVKDSQPMVGAILSTVGAMAVAVYFVIGRKLRSTLSLTPYIWTVYGTAAITLFFAVLLTKTPITGYSSEGYLWIVAVALIPQLIGHSSYNFALAYLPATYISLATQTEPLISAMAAYIIFTEAPGEWQIIGGIIILVGVVWATLGQSQNEI